MTEREEELLTLKEYAELFESHVTYLRKKAKGGKWKEACQIGGRWYVVVEQRIVRAARNRHHVA